MKRILTLDGGGIRGVFSLQILKQIQQEFRDERDNQKLVLREVFDFFAGTSTGAIIATFLAWGKTVEEIETLYIKRAEEMFSPVPLYQRYKAKYCAEKITRFFQELFCEDDEAQTPALLGTEKLWSNDAKKENAQKYLLAVMRNASTGSAWPVNNNPKAKYNLRTHPQCNLDIPLWQLLRASTAAPTFFPPESITLGTGADASTSLFMDGGITSYNNPSLIAALMATLPAYKIKWPTGADKIHVTSVGTGQVRTRLKGQDAQRIYWLDQAKYVAPALLHSVGLEQDLICRVLGQCVFGESIDSEVGDFVESADLLAATEKKFTYVRYNQTFTQEEVEEAVRATNQAFTLDNLLLIPYFKTAGQAYAKKFVDPQHLFLATT